MPGPDHNIRPDIAGVFTPCPLGRRNIVLPNLAFTAAIKIIKIQPGRERGRDQGVRIR